MKKSGWIQIALVLVGLVIFGGILIYVKSSDKQNNLKGEVVESVGSEGKVVIEEYSDFQCPACAMAAPIVSDLKKKYEDKLEVRFIDFPLTYHALAAKASEAAAAASDQGKFWEYHDILFGKQSEWTQSGNEKEAVRYFKQYAESLDLDMEKFNKSLDSGEKKDYVEQNRQRGMDMRVSATPTFYLNGKKLQGYKTWDELIGKIEAEL